MRHLRSPAASRRAARHRYVSAECSLSGSSSRSGVVLHEKRLRIKGEHEHGFLGQGAANLGGQGKHVRTLRQKGLAGITGCEHQPLFPLRLAFHRRAGAWCSQDGGSTEPFGSAPWPRGSTSCRSASTAARCRQRPGRPQGWRSDTAWESSGPRSRVPRRPAVLSRIAKQSVLLWQPWHGRC